MPKRTSSFRGDLLKDLRDPAEATNYVVACAVEGAADMGVRDVMEAAKLAERERCAEIAREHGAEYLDRCSCGDGIAERIEEGK